MGTAAEGAGIFSLASMGFQAAGAEAQAAGTSAAYTYKAEQLQRAAEYGDLKATQTAGQMTRNLNMTLGNIDAIRAAGRDDPTAPSGAAYRQMVENVGTEQTSITTFNILAQSQEDVANAAYLRQASSQALLMGDITAGADITKGIGGALSLGKAA
jgi:hypothetical protein